MNLDLALVLLMHVIAMTMHMVDAAYLVRRKCGPRAEHAGASMAL